MKKWIIASFLVVFLAVIAFLAITQTLPTITKTVQVTMTVMPKPDFTLDVGVAHVNVRIGQETSYVASVSSVNEFAGEIVFSISGIPVGAIVTFLPSNTVTIAPGQDRGCQINIAIPDDPVLIGDYTITVMASSDTYN